jgi:hypothetical protein
VAAQLSRLVGDFESWLGAAIALINANDEGEGSHQVGFFTPRPNHQRTAVTDSLW